LSEFIVYLENTLWMYYLSSEKANGDNISGKLQNKLLNCHTSHISPSSICHYCPYNLCQFVIIAHITIIRLPLLLISASSICHYCPSPNSNKSLYMYIFKNYVGLILLCFVFYILWSSIIRNSNCKQGALWFLLYFPL
jgi:hypothetical protein